jgi:tetraacyldisaccharide 4'-kinase
MSLKPLSKRYFGTAFFVSFRRMALYPFGFLWGLAAFFRNWLYNRGIWAPFRPSHPTIAIGNLSMGGTGKTPLVLYICSLLHSSTCAVISRGYGRTTKGLRRVLPGGNPCEAGDEPQLIANRMPQTTVLVSEDRIEAFHFLETTARHVEVVVLDDAFQHRKIQAGLNLLTCSWHEPFWCDAPFPAGRLREWPIGASRAQALIVTQTPQGFPALSIPKEIRNLNLPTFYTRHRLAAEATNQNGEKLLLSDLNKHHQHLIAFCGLGRPEAFQQSLIEAGILADFIAFPDHYAYSPEEVSALAQKVGPNGALITTEKDAVKLYQKAFFDILPSKTPIWSIQLEIEWESSEIQNSFHQLIHHYVATHTRHS